MNDDYKDYAGGDNDFESWLRAVDALCVAKVGLSIFDLGDYLWRDAFDDELTPLEAFRNFAEDGGIE